eukprot:TRINITY_DN66243_c3_g2_i2.p1 TRINITY_DN66243_c3_g2~~TRINITY_DN66243_c3_g2_i2.p1  ORF type:complete len:334 (+),score=28.70 TRINITY_DN66243_c3_g2_i2:34-1035(+)
MQPPTGSPSDLQRRVKWIKSTKLLDAITCPDTTSDCFNNAHPPSEHQTFVCPHETFRTLMQSGQASSARLDRLIASSTTFLNPYSLPNAAAHFQLPKDLSSLTLLFANQTTHPPPSTNYHQLRTDQDVRYSDHCVRKGVQCSKAAQYAEAIPHYERALTYDKHNSDAYVGRGAARANMGQYEDAVQDFTKALKENESHPNARKYLEATKLKMARIEAEKEEEIRKRTEEEAEKQKKDALVVDTKAIDKLLWWKSNQYETSQFDQTTGRAVSVRDYFKEERLAQNRLKCMESTAKLQKEIAQLQKDITAERSKKRARPEKEKKQKKHKKKSRKD